MSHVTSGLLRDITASLGFELLNPLVVTDAPLTEIAVLEPADEMPMLPGSLVLAPGLRDGEAAGFLRRIAAAGGSGLVLKRRQLTDDAVAELVVIANDTGTSLIIAADAAPWNQLLGLLETARSAAESVPGSVALGDLFGLANAIAAVTGGATTVEDHARRVLAYSTLPAQEIDGARQEGILGRKVPDILDNDANYRAVYRAKGVIRIEIDGLLPRLAVAVRAGSEVLGSLWILDTGTLSADAAGSLLDASRLTALHLLRARIGTDLERRARGEALRGLLDGRAAPDVVAERIGMSGAGHHLLMGVTIPGPSGQVDELLLEQLHDLVALRCAAHAPGTVTTAAGGAVWALLPSFRAADADPLAAGIAERVSSALGATATIALGEAGEPLSAVPASRVELGHVLRVLARPDSTRSIARRRDVHAALVLLELTQTLALNPRLQLDAVTGMVEHDRAQGGRYVETLVAYFDSLADIPTAAHRVAVHPNTFRYRLRRAREVFGVDLDDADERLVLWLQLKAVSES